MRIEIIFIMWLLLIGIYLSFKNLHLERELEEAKEIIEEVDDFFEKLIKKAEEPETKKKEDKKKDNK